MLCSKLKKYVLVLFMGVAALSAEEVEGRPPADLSLIPAFFEGDFDLSVAGVSVMDVLNWMNSVYDRSLDRKYSVEEAWKIRKLLILYANHGSLFYGDYHVFLANNFIGDLHMWQNLSDFCLKYGDRIVLGASMYDPYIVKRVVIPEDNP